MWKFALQTQFLRIEIRLPKVTQYFVIRDENSTHQLLLLYESSMVVYSFVFHPSVCMYVCVFVQNNYYLKVLCSKILFLDNGFLKDFCTRITKSYYFMLDPIIDTRFFFKSSKKQQNKGPRLFIIKMQIDGKGNKRTIPQPYLTLTCTFIFTRETISFQSFHREFHKAPCM